MTTEFSEAMQHQDPPSPERDRKYLVILLRQYQQAKRESDEAEAWFNAIEDVYQDEQAIRMTTLASLSIAIEELAKELLPADAKHIDVPGIARVAFRTQPEYLRVADHEAFMDWAQGVERPDLWSEAVVRKLDTAAAKELAEEARRETGELIAGMELVEAKTTMKIEAARG